MSNGGKVKKGTLKNRGYIGYHTTWDNKRVFLRSKAEFIYARVLDIKKIHYMLECVTYQIKDKRYKPDFFIFDSKYKTIKKIVEITGLDDKKTALKYRDMYTQYFNSIGIEYEVVWKYQAIITKYQLHEDIKTWVNTSISTYDHISDVSGENNPMFGKSHNASTIEKIRTKAKERQTLEYRKKNSEAQKAFWNTERGKQRKLEISVECKERAKRKNPIVDKECKNCNNLFQDKLKSKKEFCSGQCNRKWSYANIPGYGKWRKNG
jgi:hypothetical protein